MLIRPIVLRVTRIKPGVYPSDLIASDDNVGRFLENNPEMMKITTTRVLRAGNPSFCVNLGYSRTITSYNNPISSEGTHSKTMIVAI